jgi:hypothetical protein
MLREVLACLLICSALVCGADCVKAQPTTPPSKVVTYPAPKGIPASGDYTVDVGGRPVFVATAPVYHNPPASFAGFDFQGSADVTISSTRPVQSAKILPSALAIKPVIDGGKIHFTLTHPCNLTIEINGDPATALHLSANPLETNAPKPGDRGVIYFGPGVHEVATMDLRDGATVYLAGGAVVRAVLPPEEKPLGASDWAGQRTYRPFIAAMGTKNLRIYGRGIIDCSRLPWHSRNVLALLKTMNVTIEGVTFIDSPCWTVMVGFSSNVHIRNIKEICARENSDGIDICNSQNVSVDDCFLRNDDDEICVKTPAPFPFSEAKNIAVRNCVIWNDRARALGITSETRRNIDNVLFQNCDVIHDFSTAGDCAALAVIIDDSGTVSNVRFENIRLEDVKTKLLFCWIGKERWGQDSERGHLKNVTFKNITVTGNNFPVSEFSGFDEDHLVDGVTLDHVVIQGQPLSDTQQGKISINSYVRDFQMTP